MEAWYINKFLRSLSVVWKKKNNNTTGMKVYSFTDETDKQKTLFLNVIGKAL